MHVPGSILSFRDSHLADGEWRVHGPCKIKAPLTFHSHYTDTAFTYLMTDNDNFGLSDDTTGTCEKQT